MKVIMTFCSLVVATVLFAAPTYAKDVKVVNHTVIGFTPGESSLDSAYIDEIRIMVNRAREMGKIDNIEIAVWSDQERPVRGDLSRADQNLARDRAENIKRALKMAGSNESVKVFNMADGSNWLARTFKTADAELESVFAKKDAQVQREDFQVIKNAGAPSKAVLVINAEK